MKRTLGIDLGTTNSVAASNASVLSLLDGDHESSLLPSMVAFLPNGGAAIGEGAKARKPIDPKNTLYSSKRVIGESFMSYAAQQFRAQYPHELARGPEGSVEFITRAGAISPGEIAALIASHLCMRACFHPAEVPTVVTVPSAFHDRAREATLRGVRRAGFTDVRLIEEPVATAIAYMQRASLRFAAVYDFGGGTFDFAIIDCSTFPFKVLGHGGDPYLGGDDVDQALAQLIAERVLRIYGWDMRSDPLIFARLTMAAEVAKCQLSEIEKTTIDVADVDPAAPYTLSRAPVDRAMLREATMPLVRRSFGICDEVLAAVGLRAADIQAVFMAGGSTRLPLLAEMVSQYFGRRVRTDLNPEHVVALGASIAAARPELWPLLDQS
jgi:molecular chaperone DnaK